MYNFCFTQIDELQGGEILPMTLVALRIFISVESGNRNPMGLKDSEDQYFQEMYLAYLEGIRLDDLAHWTEEQIIFYNSLGFDMDAKTVNKRLIFNKIKDGILSHPRLKKNIGELFTQEKAFNKFIHWLGIITSRAHALKETEWMQCKDDKLNTGNMNKRLNSIFNGEPMTTLIPLADLPNHRQPNKADLSDLQQYKTSDELNILKQTPIKSFNVVSCGQIIMGKHRYLECFQCRKTIRSDALERHQRIHHFLRQRDKNGKFTKSIPIIYQAYANSKVKFE